MRARTLPQCLTGKQQVLRGGQPTSIDQPEPLRATSPAAAALVGLVGKKCASPELAAVASS